MAEDIDIDAIIDEIVDGGADEDDNEESVEERHAGVIAEAEAEAAREDSVTHQLRKDVRELTEKFDQSQLQHILEKFDEEADEVEKTLFKGVRAKLKTPERALEAIAEIKELAEPIRKKQQELLEQAEQKAASVWGLGSGPIGKSPPSQRSEDEKLTEKLREGKVSIYDLMETWAKIPGNTV